MGVASQSKENEIDRKSVVEKQKKKKKRAKGRKVKCGGVGWGGDRRIKGAA